jgi:hypothetical protein
MALGGKIVDFDRLDFLNQTDQVGGIAQVAVMQLEPHVVLVQVAVQMLDPSRVERRRAPLDAVDDVTLRQQKFSQISAVLPGNACNQRSLCQLWDVPW